MFFPRDEDTDIIAFIPQVVHISVATRHITEIWNFRKLNKKKDILIDI